MGQALGRASLRDYEGVTFFCPHKEKILAVKGETSELEILQPPNSPITVTQHGSRISLTEFRNDGQGGGAFNRQLWALRYHARKELFPFLNSINQFSVFNRVGTSQHCIRLFAQLSHVGFNNELFNFQHAGRMHGKIS